MCDECGHPRDRPTTDQRFEALVSTHPRQVFSGIEIGLANLRTYCLHCDRALGEGDEIVIYAYRPAEALEWDIVRCYCRDCAPAGIETPTLGTSEVLATATLGVLSRVADQLHHLCLTDVEIIHTSTPGEGIRP